MLPYYLGLKLTQYLNVCVLCRLNAIDEGYLCDNCHQDIAWLPQAFVVDCANQHTLAVQPATFYTGAMKSSISAFKDKEYLPSVAFLVHALYQLAQSLELPDDTVIVPVPTTKGRLGERGFYPVGMLASYLSAMTDFQVYTGITRPSESVHQRGLDRQQRLNNLQDVFVVEELPPSSSLLLIDDVTTTGATMVAMADTLWAVDDSFTIHAVCLAHGSPDY